MLRTALIAAVLVAPATVTFADEVIIHREREVPVEVAPPPPSRDTVVIEKRAPDCRTSQTHTEDDSGASSTVTRQECH